MHLIQTILGALIEKAYANNPYQFYCDQLGNYCGVGQDFGRLLLSNVTMIIFQLVGITAVISIIVGGIKMITGGEGGKEDGKKIIMYGAFGLAFAVVAVVFVRFFCDFFTAIFGESPGLMCNIT